MRYLETSPGFTRFYPSDTLGKMKWAWDNDGHTDYPLWRQLGARPDGPVYYGYKVAAGLAGGTPPTIDCVTKPTWAATTEPWYVIEAKGDLDGDPKFFSCVAASSFTGEVYVENEGE
jgi:hypothetical protein